MTRIEKSDAQLNAEAEARRRHLTAPRIEHGMDDPDAYDPPSFAPSGPPQPAAVGELRALIIDLRRALRYGDDVPERLHQQHTSQTPGDVDAKGWPIDTDEGGIGLPFAAKMHRFLRTDAGPSTRHVWDRGPDPKVRPAMASIMDYSERCHARHTSHLIPGSTRSLCAQLLFEVGYLGQEPEDVAWAHDLELEQVESMLLEALRYARTWRIDAEQRAIRQPGIIHPLPEQRPFRARVAT